MTIIRYLKDIQEPGMGTWYFEIDNNGTAYRQIVLYEDGVHYIQPEARILSFHAGGASS